MKQAILVAGRRTARLEIHEGATVADLVFTAGIPLDAACGGRGVCRKCRVWLGEGEYESADGQRFRVEEGEEREALGCQIRPISEYAHIRVPDESLIAAAAQIHDDYVMDRAWRRPRVVRVAVSVAACRLGRAASDLERLQRAVAERGRRHVFVPLAVMRSLPKVMRPEAHALTVTLGPGPAGDTVIHVESGDASDTPLLGLAADIGTTTVVCALVDLVDHRIVGRASRYNQQIRKAEDVASRISYCRNSTEVEWMRRLVVEETVNPLIHTLCAQAGTAPRHIMHVTAAGNTVMMHLLLGVSPERIGTIPFNPVFRHPPRLQARETGLDVAETASLDLVPAISGYVGGDIVADLYAAGMLEAEGPALLVDIGTNGEMALWHEGRLWVAATAAGPAFEGAGIRFGARAAAGAVERLGVGEGNRLEYRVIGPRRPTGLCGSALIDFLAVAFRLGWINAAGRFDVERLQAAGRYLPLRCGDRTLHACIVVPAAESGVDGPLYLSEADVAELLKAKAAIYAGIRTLTEHARVRCSDLRQLVLAGGFARHIDLQNAMEIGLLPRIPMDRIRVIGNGSLAGAVAYLLDADAEPEFRSIVERGEPVELNLVPSFADHYTDALFIPGGNPP